VVVVFGDEFVDEFVDVLGDVGQQELTLVASGSARRTGISRSGAITSDTGG
jgi:hypothetical protein